MDAFHSDIALTALKVTEEKRQICLRKSSTLNKHSDAIIILRDVVESITA